MEAKTESDRDFVVLPLGKNVVSKPTTIDSKQEEFKGEGTSADTKKVWYVIVEVWHRAENTISADGKSLSIGTDRIERTWKWAHTKSWARELAKREEAKGHTVVDIFPGTKAHISHKFRGLK